MNPPASTAGSAFCAGVLAWNLGGQRGRVVRVHRLVKQHGFAPLVDVLFWLSAGTLAVGVVYWILEERPPESNPEPPA